jgi:hypothetical protein
MNRSGGRCATGNGATSFFRTVPPPICVARAGRSMPDCRATSVGGSPGLRPSTFGLRLRRMPSSSPNSFLRRWARAARASGVRTDRRGPMTSRTRPFGRHRPVTVQRTGQGGRTIRAIWSVRGWGSPVKARSPASRSGRRPPRLIANPVARIGYRAKGSCLG